MLVRKNCSNSKVFMYFMYSFLWQNVIIFSRYIYIYIYIYIAYIYKYINIYSKTIEISWSRYISSIVILEDLELSQVFSILFLIYCFQYFLIYILEQNAKNIRSQTFLNYIKYLIFIVKMTRHSKRFLIFIKSLCPKMF